MFFRDAEKHAARHPNVQKRWVKDVIAGEPGMPGNPVLATARWRRAGAMSLPIKAPPNENVGELWQTIADLQPIADEYRLLVEHIRDYALIRFDETGHVKAWSPGAEQMLGFSAQEALGQPSAAFFTPEERDAGDPEREMVEATRDGRAKDERWHIRRDGSRFWGSGIMTAIRDRRGQLTGYYKIVRDLTAKHNAEEAVRESEGRLRRFIENVRDYALVELNPENRITGWNAGAERVFGYTEAEILDRDVAILFTPEDRAAGKPAHDAERALKTGRAEDERWMVRRDGARFICRWVTTPIRSSEGEVLGFAKVLRDETARRTSERRLERSLAERETLLKEIHHRVKNNLQVIVSLLRLQANMISDPVAHAMFQDTQTRVHAIAGIHEILYTSPDLANIEFDQYLRRLVKDLFAFYGTPPEKVQLDIQAADLVLDITQAIPLGLILNELVVNALRHAFPQDRLGKLTITLAYLDERSQPGETLDQGRGRLTVCDDGVGMPPDFDFDSSTSMGMYLVRVLSRQLRGNVEQERRQGTCFSITFPLTLDDATSA